MQRISCAFTGHRPSKLPWHYDETAEGCMQLKATLAVQEEAIALLSQVFMKHSSTPTEP